VHKIGTKEAVDPYTREDALWKLLDFCTARNLYELAFLSENPSNIINE